MEKLFYTKMETQAQKFVDIMLTRLDRIFSKGGKNAIRQFKEIIIYLQDTDVEIILDALNYIKKLVTVLLTLFMRDSQPYNFFRFTSKSDLQPLQKIQCLTLYKIGSELTISSCQNLTTVTVFGVKLHNISLKAKCSIIKYKSLAARLPKLFRSTLILPFLHSNYSTYNFSPFTHLSSFCSEFSLGG